MQQVNYILKRILQMIPVLLVITIVIFWGMRLIPGDPATTLLGEKATPEAIAAMHRQMGLDKPILSQYLIFLKQLATFDLGNSTLMNKPVAELFRERSVVTVTYTVMTALLSLIVSIPLGYIAGVSRNGKAGKAITTGALVFLSLPEFWFGILLLMLFGLRLAWFPVGGWGDTWPQHIYSMVLPSLTGAIGTIALLTRNIQSGVVEVLKKDYVNFAASKGLSQQAIRSRYILKNVMISTVTLFAMRVAYMFGGSVIIETVFALPGLGSLLVNGVMSRDYAVVQGTVFIFAVIVLVITLITDICYSLLDPRVKLQ
jgi:peptide/nickel transport system permease protein